ncbi:hypothetical protein ABIB62_002501 [Mucilaginibacter sp. UYP25]
MTLSGKFKPNREIINKYREVIINEHNQADIFAR